MESYILGLKDRIVLARKEFGVSQKNLAEKIGVSVATLNRYEKGSRVPDSNFLKQFAQVTGCNIEWLLLGEQSTGEDDNEMLQTKLYELMEKYVAVLEENKLLHKIIDDGGLKKSRVGRKKANGQ